jgi:hypothetical protein
MLMSEVREKIFEKIAGSSKKVILVEGKEDETAYKHLLDKKYSNWERLIFIFPAGGKINVINELEKSPDFIGIIDKDEWWDEDIRSIKAEIENLIVIPRYCMESYLVNPEEIWESLPANMHQEVNYDVFKDAILENIQDWTKHAALWHAVLPLYSNLKKAGFNQVLLNEIEKIKEESFIKAKLNEWHNILDPENTFKKYQSLLSEIADASLQDKLQKWIHGKKFWEVHVSKKMNMLFGQKSQIKYANEIWKHRLIPGDWDNIWPEISNFQPALREKTTSRNNIVGV